MNGTAGKSERQLQLSTQNFVGPRRIAFTSTNNNILDFLAPLSPAEPLSPEVTARHRAV